MTKHYSYVSHASHCISLHGPLKPCVGIYPKTTKHCQFLSLPQFLLQRLSMEVGMFLWNLRLAVCSVLQKISVHRDIMLVLWLLLQANSGHCWGHQGRKHAICCWWTERAEQATA